MGMRVGMRTRSVACLGALFVKVYIVLRVVGLEHRSNVARVIMIRETKMFSAVAQL